MLMCFNIELVKGAIVFQKTMKVAEPFLNLQAD